jgi:predicted transcriptional regulator
MTLSPIEEKVLKALIELGATNENNIKTADHVMKKANLAKGMVGNALTSLVNKGIVKRVAREKASGYYVVKQQE